MKELSINLLKLCLVWAISIFLVASCSKPSYANHVHPHGELALVGYNSLAHSPLYGLFLCVFSPLMRFMVRLEGDTFGCAGNLTDQSTNPFQLCRPHLVVNGKASKQPLGAH
ncbi:hypothetical protein [Acinetobacter wuhouensis]|uniref:Lipoprotein n=1 Tax=Acinetobacter wuhouensis TaxID=1879050 RepID=A0A3G2T4U8_9GAMM|nr:hypothetical protein [Acinetobacter wuhouensis]AYO55269.1 hypothetical protein CDG68_17115 [Acinetobacter wuhouensis]